MIRAGAAQRFLRDKAERKDIATMQDLSIVREAVSEKRLLDG